MTGQFVLQGAPQALDPVELGHRGQKEEGLPRQALAQLLLLLGRQHGLGTPGGRALTILDDSACPPAVGMVASHQLRGFRSATTPSSRRPRRSCALCSVATGSALMATRTRASSRQPYQQILRGDTPVIQLVKIAKASITQ